MTDPAEDVIARLNRGLTLWSTTPMMCDVIELAIATVASQAADIEWLTAKRDELRALIASQAAEIERLRESTGWHGEGLMTEAEAYAHIESLSSGPNGGWTRAALAELGVKWPPRKGWKIAVVRRLTGGKLPEDVSDDADEEQGVLQGFSGYVRWRPGSPMAIAESGGVEVGEELGINDDAGIPGRKEYVEDNERLAADNQRLNDELAVSQKALAWMAGQVKDYAELPDDLVAVTHRARDEFPSRPAPDLAGELVVMNARLKKLEDVLEGISFIIADSI